MVIQARSIVGAAVALALVGVAMWVSAVALSPPQHAGSVEVTQLPERSWAVEVKQIGGDKVAGEALTASR